MKKDKNLEEFDYLGSFIRSYRSARGESLQSLANRSQVSRSMIAQIESCQTSPTLAVLYKLSQAMDMELSDLVRPPESQVAIETNREKNTNIVSKKGSAFTCHLLHRESRHFSTEVYSFYFKKFGRTSFAANTRGARKNIWLQEGELTLAVADKVTKLYAKTLITFNASIPHRFICESQPLARGLFFVSY
ncbi:helix-turn-helix domain-containing protein [Agarilytica rhodophyticola]|uniref:helix-turn-helix domain-containing protein n=1 Tax=Agarilytica rhodophyticola TaxID=1737490 RepID=UPI000B348AE6|nr:helix-turn-helix transcriptional regulator [Agarilytica rhodophyticola]